MPEHVLPALRGPVTSELDRLHQVAKQESQWYKAERDALGDEGQKLMQAHHAAPCPSTSSPPSRTASRVGSRSSTRRSTPETSSTSKPKAHLDDCLGLAGDMHAIYMSIDSPRRIANQAFFDKLIVTDDDTIDGEPGVPFNVFLNPDVQTLALRHQRRATESGTQTGDVVGLNNDLLVGPEGLEPPTPAV